MKKHYIAIGLILGLGVLTGLIIIATAPSSKANSQTASATPTLDRNDTLRGGSVDGQLIFSRQGVLWRWRGDTAHPLNLPPGNSVVANNTVQLIQPALSRDGSRLAYVRQDETFSDLWLAGSDGSGAHALTNNRGNGTPRSPGFLSSSLWAFGPNWSPDGIEIAYLSDVGTDDLTLRATNATKFNQRAINSRLAVAQGGVQRPGWSPQGDSLVLAAFENGKSQIYTVKAANGQPTKLTDQADGAYDPAWSPDGKFIAFTTRRGSAGEIWVMHADGTAPALLTNLDSRQPVWSPDGKKVAFVGLKDGGFEFFTLDVTPEAAPVGQPRQLSQNARLDGVSGFTWSK